MTHMIVIGTKDSFQVILGILLGRIRVIKGEERGCRLILLPMPWDVEWWASDIATDDIKLPYTAAVSLVSRMMSCVFRVPARIIESSDDTTGGDRLQ